MCNDIELFINLINFTDIMSDLLLKNTEAYIECQTLLDYNKIHKIDEIIKINNNTIKIAIKEVLNNERFMKVLEEESDIDMNLFKQIL